MSKEELSDKEILKRLGENTRKNLKNQKVKIQKRVSTSSKPNKYSKKNPKTILYFHMGYDLLQYNIAVRPYLKKMYGIKKDIELDILLYLFPIQFFTLTDFKELPVKQYNYHLKTLVDLGYAEICVKKVNGSDIYRLTDHARAIVVDYYKLLSGEKTINSKRVINPFRNQEKSKADKIREKILLKLKHQAEKNPSKFTNPLT